MQSNHIQLSLIRSPSDPEIGNDMMQSEFRGFSKSLGAHGIKADPIYFAFDSVSGGGGLVGEYIIPLAQVIVPTLGVVLAAWLQGQSKRKIHLKIENVAIEASTVEDIDLVLRKIKELQHHTPQENISEAQDFSKYEGKSPVKKKIIPLWVVFIFVVFILGAIGEAGKQKNTSTNNQTTASGDSVAPDICNFSDVQKNVAVEAVRSQGYDCASVYSMCRYAFSEGFTLACTGSGGEFYKFEFENHGGKWSVKAD